MTKRVHAAHILVGDETRARDIMSALRSGKDFRQMAKKFSKCPSGKNGGDLGWFGKGEMVKEFENAAFNAKKGELVGPVKTEFGWHVIKVLERE
ncbi:MAG: peptidylprolyl isomerase [Methanomassiliicoccales archaeon]